MKRPQPSESWPKEVKVTYKYDQIELWGESTDAGYMNSYHLRRNMAFDLIEQYVAKGSRILDVAGAGGNFSLPLAEKGYRVVWNDLREELIPYLELKYEKGDITYCPGNIFEQTFEELFDCILACEIIEHVAHPDEFLMKLATLLKPGGVVVLTTPNGSYFNNRLPSFIECADPSIYESVQFKPNSDGHIFLFTPAEIKLLSERAGLSCLACMTFTNFITAGQLKSHILLKALPARITRCIEPISQLLPGFISDRLNVSMAGVFKKI